MLLFLILKYKSLIVKTSLPCLFLSQLHVFGCQMHFVYRSKLVLCITKTAVFGSPFVACLGRYAKADSNIKYFGVAWGIKGGSRTGAPGARPPFEKKMGLVFVNVHWIYANTLILVNMQCLQYVYFSLLF